MLFRKMRTMIGELWFDGQASTAAEDCVVVRMRDPDDCFMLLLATFGRYYRRLGAGHIKACCLSRDYGRGTIV